MKALAYNPESPETNYLSPTEVKKPTLTENNAIVKVSGVGICGSDLLKLDRALVKAGTILGHEMVGIIDEISLEMTEKYGFKTGDRILSSHHVPCLECDYCLRGKESLCQSFKSSNFNPGAFCEYLELSEGHLKHTVQKIPNHLSNEEASFTEPLACCIKAARGMGVREWGIGKVLVIGLGSIGLIMGQAVKQIYPDSELTGLDLIQNRLDLAKELGFHKTINPQSLIPNPCSQEKYDSIFLCAGASATVDLAIDLARDGATIVVFSSVADSEKAFKNNDIYYKELTIQSSYSPNLENLREALQLISDGKIKVNQLIDSRAGLDNLGETIKAKRGIKTYLELNN